MGLRNPICWYASVAHIGQPFIPYLKYLFKVSMTVTLHKTPLRGEGFWKGDYGGGSG